MTEVGSIVGTAQYLSPEQARGEVVGPPSDLYSVGIVLYEMLTGRVPFEGDSAVAIAMKHLSEEPVPPSVYAPGTPPALEQVVLRALAKDAGDRYQTAEEMSADLDRARRGVALSPRTEQMTRVIAPVHTARQTAGRAAARRDARLGSRGAAAARRQPPPPPPVRPKRSRWPWVLLALLVLAAGAVAAVALSGVIGGGNSTTTTVAPTVVRVPSGLVGLDEAPATAKLQRAGLTANPVTRASSQTPGVVIGVSPPGGKQVKRGSSVTLLISKGVNLVTVPTVTGKTLQEATALLTQKGLKVGNQTETNDLAAAGTVIAQNPVAAATAPAGSSVALTISKGPTNVLVPDLTGQDLPTAKQTLAGAKLKPGSIRRVASNDQPAGSVVSNDPPGGTQAPEGSPVNMVLSTGPKKVIMPEVYGLKSADAAQKIQDAGLVPRPPSSFPTNDPALDDTVRKTSPQPGTPVREGSNVIISVYRYTAPTTDTTTTTTTTPATTPDTAPEPEPVSDRLRVVVLAGGRSSEREISFASARSVAAALDPERYEVLPVTIGEDGAWRLLASVAELDDPGADRRVVAGRAASGHERARDARRRGCRIARGRRCRVPCPARPVRRGRDGAGPVRDGGASVRRLGRARLLGRDGQGSLQERPARRGDRRRPLADAA